MIVLAVDTIKIGESSGNDPLAVHKWELWDNDLNVTGTGRFPYVKIGSMEIPYELTLAGFENLITGIFALVNSTENKYGFTSIVTSDDPGNPIPSGIFLNYGTHSGNGGASVLRVGRMCNLTDTGYCNTGSLADFGDFSNTFLPNIAMSVASDAPASLQILRLNGYLLDPGSQMIYLANTANTAAIIAENGDLVCTNLNADMVDSKHAADFVTITGDQYITGSLGLSDNMTAAYFMGDGSLLTGIPIPAYVSYANDSDKVDGKHSTDFLWLDGSQNMTGPLNLGVNPLTAYSTLRFSVPAGNNFVFENETGDIRLVLSDKGQFYLYDFLEGYGSGKSMNLMHLGDNAYISSSDGILLDPSNLKTTVTGNLTADYHLGDGRYLTNLPKASNATYSDLANNSYNLGNKPASAYLTSNGMASEASYPYVNGTRNMTGTLTVPSIRFNSPATMSMYGDSAELGFGGKILSYVDTSTPYNQIIMRVDVPDISIWSGGSKYISLSRLGGGYSSILSNDDIHIDATAGNQDIYMDGNSLIAQSVYDETSGGSANVYVDTDGHLYRSTSSARYKTNIADLSTDTSRIYDIRLREYDYNTTNNQLKNKATHSIGLIAEEAVLIMPEVVVYGNNTLDGINYPHLTISMLNEMKKLRTQNTDLKNRLYTMCVNNGLKGCS